jgi:protease I
MKLSGKQIAVLAEDLFEDLELWYPVIRMREEGAKVAVLGTGKSEYHGKHGLRVKPDLSVDDASPEDFQAVIIPGGYSPDRMRRHKPLLQFVRGVFDSGSVVAFICHAGWVPISAGIVGGRRVTSFFSIKDDLTNAGATWVDEEVVRDGNLISSRDPRDLPAFCRTIIAEVSGGGLNLSQRADCAGHRGN